MKDKFKIIHTIRKEKLNNNPQWNMPYVPAIKVLSGKPLYISGVNAAPIYHSHPHKPDEFENIDFNPENQTRLAMENLKAVLSASDGTLNDVVQLFVFIVDMSKNGEIVEKIVSDYFKGHLCSSTVVGINELITDPKLIVEITAVAYVD